MSGNLNIHPDTEVALVKVTQVDHIEDQCHAVRELCAMTLDDLASTEDQPLKRAELPEDRGRCAVIAAEFRRAAKLVRARPINGKELAGVALQARRVRQLEAALRVSRGWVITCGESAQARRDLKTIDAALAARDGVE